MRSNRLFAGALAVALSSLAAAQMAGEAVRVALFGGDVLSGVLVEESATAVVIEHPALGLLTINRQNIVSVTGVADVPEGEAAATPAEAAQPPAPDAGMPTSDEPAALPEKAEPKWSGRLEFGLSGNEGNTEQLNLVARAEATRETEEERLQLSTQYRRAEQDGELTESRWISRGRNDWLFPGSPWGFYALVEFDYDEFADWDSRLSGSLGPTYLLIDTERTELSLRAGLGGSQTFGGDEDEFRPEGVLGADLEHKINSRLLLTASAEYIPDLGDFSTFRANLEAALEIKLSENGGWMLKLGVEDRYDSDPGDAEKNDLYYTASMVYEF